MSTTEAIRPKSATPAPKTETMRPKRDLRYLWLTIGAALSLFALHGRWDIPAAAWLFSIFLLRFSRTSKVLSSTLWIALVGAIGATYWVFQAGLPVDGIPWAPLLGCIALSLILVLPFLADRLIATRLRERHPILATFVFPSARVGCEFLIAIVSPFGTIFGSLASTQHDALSLLQISSVTGAYGVSFLIAWLAPVVCELWQRRTGWRTLVTYGCVLAAVLGFGALNLSLTSSSAKSVRVASISPSRSVTEVKNTALIQEPEDVAKADPAQVRPMFNAITDDLLASTEREAQAGAKIVVWAEAATEVLEQDKEALLRKVGEVATRHQIYIEVGVGVHTHTEPYGMNQTILIDPTGNPLWTYDKAHPVPGMEPWEPGNGVVPTTQTPYGKLANIICYDADFPDTARVDADTMLVPSADWPEFGELHTAKARLRAVENGYSLVRQDSHGLSAAYDPQGRLLSSNDYFRTNQQTMVTDVPTEGHPTAYRYIGDVFAWTCVAATGLLLVGAIFSRRPVTN